MDEFGADEDQYAAEHSGRDEYYDGDDEALSLSDLPLIYQSRMQIDGGEIRSRQPVEPQEDFDFCSVSKESEMCTADEVFFQGQILPLRRHSVSSGDGSSISNRSIPRSRSMDFHDSGGLIASRSSSISSRQSSSSGGSSAGADDRYKKPPPNLFHSHPSPSPKLQPIGRNNGNNTTTNRNCTNKSSAWSIFRLGLIAAPPKIVFHEPKTLTNSKNGGNRNSRGRNTDKKNPRPNFLSGCNCLLDAVDTVPSKVVVIKRSASDGQQAEIRKKRDSHHRTFEWLKLLSIEGAEEVTVSDEPQKQKRH